MSNVGRSSSGSWIWPLISWATPGKLLNGVPAPLAEDEDSDFGHESWYDRKDDKKGKSRDRRVGKRGASRKSGAKNPVKGDDDRAADFNLLDHGFLLDESDEESFFDNDHSE